MGNDDNFRTCFQVPGPTKFTIHIKKKMNYIKTNLNSNSIVQHTALKQDFKIKTYTYIVLPKLNFLTKLNLQNGESYVHNNL